MTIVKTKDLTGAALNYAVALCEGLTLHKDALLNGAKQEGWYASGYYMDPNRWLRIGRLSYSTEWAQGGPIIEREKIKVFPNVGGTWSATIRHTKTHPLVSHQVLAGWTHGSGSTPLIAAMRCYVASKLGDVVEIPEELL